MSEWNIGAAADAIADRTMTVCGDRRSASGESADRTRRLANCLAGRRTGSGRLCRTGNAGRTGSRW